MKYAAMIVAVHYGRFEYTTRSVLFSVEADTKPDALTLAAASDHNTKLLSDHWLTDVFVAATEGTFEESVVVHERELEY